MIIGVYIIIYSHAISASISIPTFIPCDHLSVSDALPLFPHAASPSAAYISAVGTRCSPDHHLIVTSGNVYWRATHITLLGGGRMKFPLPMIWQTKPWGSPVSTSHFWEAYYRPRPFWCPVPHHCAVESAKVAV